MTNHAPKVIESRRTSIAHTDDDSGYSYIVEAVEYESGAVAVVATNSEEYVYLYPDQVRQLKLILRNKGRSK